MSGVSGLQIDLVMAVLQMHMYWLPVLAVIHDLYDSQAVLRGCDQP